MVLLVGDKGATLVLLLILFSVLGTPPNIVIVEASGTIYIRADGSVEGTDKIQCDGNVYSFTDNLYEPLVVEKDDIVVDGAGHSIEGLYTGLAQSPEGIGILVESRSDVTISNVTIQRFLYGICINSSSKNRITKSNITNNSKGIIIEHSSDNRIRESQMTNNLDVGIYVFESSNTHIDDNIIADNANDGISLILASGDLNVIDYCDIRDNGVGIRIMNSSFWHYVTQNNITNNSVGIHLESSSTCIQFNNIANNGVGIQIAGSDNEIDHNNFISNTKQVYYIAWNSLGMSPSVNSWYEGDTGNYWSDYNGTGETPYLIDENNQDNFPVMKPFIIPYHPTIPTIEDYTISNILWSITIIAVLGALLLIYFRRAKSTGKNQTVNSFQEGHHCYSYLLCLQLP
jgi:parallel beta-helix repeat protein